jgi:tetratricopeptide (TPR) repeat protein
MSFEIDLPSAPDDADAVAARASELIDRRRLSMAHDLLAAALRREPGHMGLQFEMARVLYLQDDNDAAKDLLGRVLVQQPEHVNARFLLSSVELDRRDLPAAEQAILSLLRQYPQHAEFYAQYARVMLRALHFEKADQLALEALRFDPDGESGLQVRVLCDIATCKQGADIQALRRLVAHYPDDVRTLRLVVLALVHAGRHGEALRLARQLLRAQPDDQSMLELVRSLHHGNHWSLWPLRPLQRWGWAGSAAFWVVMLLTLQLLRRVAPDWAGPVSWAWLALVAYSWLWPPLLQRWLRRETS